MHGHLHVFTAKSQEIYEDFGYFCLDAWFLARALAAEFWIGKRQNAEVSKQLVVARWERMK